MRGQTSRLLHRVRRERSPPRFGLENAIAGGLPCRCWPVGGAYRRLAFQGPLSSGALWSGAGSHSRVSVALGSLDGRRPRISERRLFAAGSAYDAFVCDVRVPSRLPSVGSRAAAGASSQPSKRRCGAEATADAPNAPAARSAHPFFVRRGGDVGCARGATCEFGTCERFVLGSRGDACGCAMCAGARRGGGGCTRR